MQIYSPVGGEGGGLLNHLIDPNYLVPFYGAELGRKKIDK
jgi:hypothetical protein